MDRTWKHGEVKLVLGAQRRARGTDRARAVGAVTTETTETVGTTSATSQRGNHDQS